MKVSVAVATYNGENFIEEQLVSIGEQGYQPSEIVICDDGSSDDTLFICEKFSRKSSFPCLIFRNEKRLGFADNFLRAASLCSGDLIAFCDQDDVWTKDKLARCVAWFQRSSEIMLVSHNAWVVEENLDKLRLLNQKKTTLLNILGIEIQEISLPGFTLVFLLH